MARLFSLFAVAFLGLQLVQVDRASAASNRIVAVGDIHSDYKQALAVLQMAKIIDSKGDWIAGQDTFVQTVSLIKQ
jgi:cephalosporin hydroxylase